MVKTEKAAERSEGGSRVVPWTVLSSETTYEDRWLKLRSDHCVDADGRSIAPYHVIERPDWVNVVALTHSGQLVLVREYRHGVGQVMLGLVCGGIEADDGPDLAARIEGAARRELLEETGYEAERWLPILATFPNSANHSNRVTSFLALGAELRAVQQLDDNEAIEVAPDDFVDVVLRVRDGAMTMQAMDVAALWSAVARILLGGPALGDIAPLQARLLEALT
ncbi:MAG: NUDIX hydrolase [Caulobacteraceae bacterium]